MSSIDLPTRLRTRQWYIMAFFVVLGFYLLSFPENRHENDDGYRYAHLVKESPIETLSRPKFVLYLPLMKVLYTAWDSTGPWKVDAYRFLCTISAVFASVSLLMLFHILYKELRLGFATSALAAALFLIAYDQWRYAVEADVYATSNMLVISSLWAWLSLGRRKEIHWKDTLWVGLLSSITVLMYKPNFIPVFLCFPLLLLFKKQWLPVISYTLVGGLIIIPSYYLAYTYLQVDSDSFSYFVLGGLDEVEGSLKMIVFLLPTKIMSANFMFGIDAVIDTLKARFPGHMVEEEIYAAQQNGILNYMALGTTVLALVCLLLLCFRSIKIRPLKTLPPLFWVAVVWFLFYSASLAMVDPNSPEPWSMVILPMVLMIGLALFAPYIQRYGHVLPMVLLLVIFVHNIIGGFGVIRHLESNLTHYKSIWIIENAQKEDLILTLGSSNLEGYVAYHADIKVMSMEQGYEDCIRAAIDAVAQQHKVYFTEEVFSPSPSIKFRNPEDFEKAERFLNSNRHLFRLVNDTPTSGKIYEFTGKFELQTSPLDQAETYNQIN